MNIKYAPGETYGGSIKYAPRGNLRREHQARPHRHHVNVKYAPRATYGGNIEFAPWGSLR